MGHPFAAFLLPALLVFPAFLPQVQSNQKPSERRNREVYVSVLDSKG